MLYIDIWYNAGPHCFNLTRPITGAPQAMRQPHALWGGYNLAVPDGWVMQHPASSHLVIWLLTSPSETYKTILSQYCRAPSYSCYYYYCWMHFAFCRQNSLYLYRQCFGGKLWVVTCLLLFITIVIILISACKNQYTHTKISIRTQSVLMSHHYRKARGKKVS